MRKEELLLIAEHGKLFGNVCIIFRVKDTKTFRLELLLESKNTEPVRNRRINIERLQSDPLAFCGVRMKVECSHIVKAIRKFHDNDPEIVNHGDEHLAKTPDRAFFSAIFDGGELREPLTNSGNIISEAFPNIVFRPLRILNHIM